MFVALFASHKIDKVLIVTVQTTVNLKSISSNYGAKYSSASYIIANVPRCLSHFEEPTFLCNGDSYIPNQIIVLQNETIGPGEKDVLTLSFIFRR